jgi:hypothetical protein
MPTSARRRIVLLHFQSISRIEQQQQQQQQQQLHACLSLSVLTFEAAEKQTFPKKIGFFRRKKTTFTINNSFFNQTSAQMIAITFQFANKIDYNSIHQKLYDATGSNFFANFLKAK